MMLINTKINSVEYLNEVYFGKTNSIKNIEDQIGVFRSKYLETSYSKRLKFNVNDDPDLLKINRMLEDEFGFGCCALTVYPSMVPNAFTMPISYNIDNSSTIMKYAVKSSNSGFKYDKSYKYALITFISTAIIFNPDYSNAEVLAVILHEIGHNFYASLNNAGAIYADIIRTFNIFSILSGNVTGLAQSNIVKGSVADTMNKYRADKGLMNGIEYIILAGIGLIDFINTHLSVAINLVTLKLPALMYIVLNRAISIAYNPIGLAFLPFQYNDERVADNFVSIYGYGSELITALNKMEKSPVTALDDIALKIPVYNFIYHTISLPLTFVILSADPHPENISRCQDQINILENEAKKTDLDPKMRKVILNDISKIKKTADEMTKIDIKDPRVVSTAWKKFLYDNLHSADTKIFINDFMFKNKRYADIDSSYKRSKI